jgi:phosphohistidine swiveling domain-containing protein
MAITDKNLFKHLQKYKWVSFISRQFDLLTVIANARGYGQHLKRITGINYEAMAYLAKSDVVQYYRDEQEHLNFKKQLREIILKNPDRILGAFKEAENLNNLMRAEISEYSAKNVLEGVKLEFLLNIFKEKYQLFERQFAPCTVIPFFVGLVEEDLGLDDENDKIRRIKKISKKLRQFSYQQYHEEVIKKVIEAISRASGYTMKALEHLTPEEIMAIGKENQLRGKIKRKGNYFYLNLSGQEYLTFQFSIIKRAEKLLKTEDSTFAKNFIFGKSNFKGKVRGTVKIVYAKKDFKKFNQGDVLVTINSNPFLMPVIKKCSAIVADEGGITCHAAIISRELKIPCIIGTKIATKVFKDGDLVEVDANKGIVKLIKRKK